MLQVRAKDQRQRPFPIEVCLSSRVVFGDYCGLLAEVTGVDLESRYVGILFNAGCFLSAFMLSTTLWSKTSVDVCCTHQVPLACSGICEKILQRLFPFCQVSCLSCGYSGRSSMLTTRIRLAPRLKWAELYLRCPCMPSYLGQGPFYLFFSFT